MGLIPDDARRRATCECIGNAMQADRAYGGARDKSYESNYLDKLQQCSTLSGAKNDPFGILGNDEPKPAYMGHDVSNMSNDRWGDGAADADAADMNAPVE